MSDTSNEPAPRRQRRDGIRVAVQKTRENHDRIHLFAMLALTFTTGIVDAVGYLGLDKVFTANMTGNVVILGMALAGAEGLPIVGPLIAAFAFLAGVAIGGRGLNRWDAGWSRRVTTTLTVSGAIVIALGIGAAVVVPTEGTPWAYAITGLLAAAMGMQAGAARKIAVADVPTVVITSTMVGLAYNSRFVGGDGKNAPRRAAAILLILAGAALGALLLRMNLGLGLLVAGGLMIAVALFGHLGRAALPEPAQPVNS